MRPRVSETFDYEARARYTVRVRVTDATGRSLEKDLTVNVGDEPEASAGADGPPSSFQPVSKPVLT